jgi:hypothetical protein
MLRAVKNPIPSEATTAKIVAPNITERALPRSLMFSPETSLTRFTEIRVALSISELREVIIGARALCIWSKSTHVLIYSLKALPKFVKSDISFSNNLCSSRVVKSGLSSSACLR